MLSRSDARTGTGTGTGAGTAAGRRAQVRGQYGRRANWARQHGPVTNTGAGAGSSEGDTSERAVTRQRYRRDRPADEMSESRHGLREVPGQQASARQHKPQQGAGLP